MNLRLKRYFDTISGIARLVLAGVLIPLSFFDYFGQTGWVFASCFGSQRGGTLALIMFILGSLLIKEFNFKKTAVSEPICAAVTAVMPYLAFFSGKLLPKTLIMSFVLILICLFPNSKKAILIMASMILLSSVAGEFIPNFTKPETACVNAVSDGALYCAGLRLIIDKKQLSPILFGTFAAMGICVI